MSFGLSRVENIVELVAVHLDMDGADGRAVGHDAEIAEQLLDRIVGQQRDPVVRLEPALRKNVAKRPAISRNWP